MPNRKYSDLFAGFSEITALEKSLRSGNRFFPGLSGELRQFLADAREHVKPLGAGTELHRARIMPSEWELLPDAPLKKEEMGAPPAETATGGRLNPEGVPYLYTAADPTTALAEVRPWLFAKATLAKLVLAADVSIVDLRGVTVGRGMFRWFSYMARLPVHRDDRWGYLVTQYLAEALKDDGHDGVSYGSAQLRDGSNFAFFDPTVAEVSSVRLVRIVELTHRAEAVLPPQAHDPDLPSLFSPSGSDPM